MSFNGFPSKRAHDRVQRDRRLGAVPRATRKPLKAPRSPSKAPTSQGKLRTEKALPELPKGDGRPLQKEGWVGVICGQSGSRFVGPRIEAVAVPPDAIPYPRGPLASARVWETGFGPRDATAKELKGIPALLLDNWRGHVAADRAMSGYGEGSL